MARNIAVAEISFDLLGRLMMLPAGQRVVRAEYSITTDSLRVLLEGDGLPETEQFCPAISITAACHEVRRTELSWPQVSRG